MLTEEEESFKYYQDSGFYYINLYLRKEISNDEIIKFNIIQHIKNIDKLFVDKLFSEESNKLIVFRGIKGNNIYHGKDYGFVSTSTDINVAIKFAGKTGKIYELRIDDGIQYINKNMYINFESEILLPRNLIYTIVSTNKYKKNLYCIMNVRKDE